MKISILCQSGDKVVALDSLRSGGKNLNINVVLGIGK